MDYDPLKISFPWRNATGKIALQPILLFSVTLTSDAVGVADITLYNGASNAEETKLVIGAASGDTRQVSFNPPLFFDKGLYVAKGSNVSGFQIQYQEQRE